MSDCRRGARRELPGAAYQHGPRSKYAEDGLHLSPSGYALLSTQLLSQLPSLAAIVTEHATIRADAEAKRAASMVVAPERLEALERAYQDLMVVVPPPPGRKPTDDASDTVKDEWQRAVAAQQQHAKTIKDWKATLTEGELAEANKLGSKMKAKKK